MIRGFHLADFITLGNAACGVLSVFLAMLYMASGSLTHFLLSALMTPLAFVFDVFDGKVARWRHQHSPLGRELDSLADVISFGVGPAALGFAAGLQGGWDIAILCYFVCCGVSRLARFNITADELSAGGDKVSLLRGHAHPHQRGHHRGAGLGRLAGRAGRAAVGRRLAARAVAAAPDEPAVRGCRARR